MRHTCRFKEAFCMAHKSDDFNQLKGFQRTMYRLANERYPEIYSDENNTVSAIGPHDIAILLYEKHYDLVAPRGYAKKHSEYKEKNIAAIKKCVERDFLKENPWDVSSSYMYAYSKLFHVSMDFLYGNTDLFSDNYDVRKVCEKTGLSEKAVEHLLSDEEVYICDFAFNDFANAIEEDAEYEKVIYFWNRLLESDLYTKLPESYFRMACSSFFYKLCKDAEETARTTKSILPPKEEFVEIVDEYYACGGDVYIPNGMSLEDLYDNDKEQALEIIRDIDHERWYDLSEDLQKIESIYWGCSGQFDRFIQNYFHEQAEQYKVKLYNMHEEEQ